MKTGLSVPLSVLVSTLSLFQGSPAQAQEITPYSPKDERKLLGPRYEGRLVPLAQMNQLTESDSDDTMIFIHGRSGSIKNFTQLLLNTPKFSDYQLYYFAYDDLHRSLKRSAGDLALNILKLKSPRITIIAHSMGGLIAREALNTLTRAGHNEHLPQIRVISIDSPWQGGSSVNGKHKGANLDDMVEYFMPAALADLRSSSDFFQQLYKTEWPKQFSMELYFAQHGTQALDHQEAAILRLPEKIANLFTLNEPMKGSLYEMNFWNAISTSSQYPAFVNELSALHEFTQLTADDVKNLLEKHYPRFPGDHTSVLNTHPSAEMDLSKYLQAVL
ncbi:alpha/beta hydrolase [Bdellovibrio sp. SKB1291214]|uniref:esterase/lipase family protein n=1 Tax=Bdellovibrio sp. SKB1291214 TaxID=1732569 RepID=UPI000B51B539|nr:alpha/beta hydrolase [Bdellovibrio sp. SKB1291214]UYL09132.1 alpha/beta hydrolase [Bdellovibrio sp. SKB1291214]